MFVQVIQGTVDDPAALRAAVDEWSREVAPGATGWLGSTSGVTADGRSIAVVRFDSEAAAMANSARPEQDQWWAQTSKLFDGEPTFSESSDVTVDTTGDPATAGFVQIMQGHGSDPARAKEIISRDGPDWAAFRPEILGSVAVNFDDGGWTMVSYFSTEAAAREGEAREVPEHLKANMDELMSLSTGEMTFFDLKDPWLHTPA